MHCCMYVAIWAHYIAIPIYIVCCYSTQTANCPGGWPYLDGRGDRVSLLQVAVLSGWPQKGGVHRSDLSDSTHSEQASHADQ